MAYIIAEPCVGTCDTACVEVCPVDCIHESSYTLILKNALIVVLANLSVRLKQYLRKAKYRLSGRSTSRSIMITSAANYNTI